MESGVMRMASAGAAAADRALRSSGFRLDIFGERKRSCA